MAKSKRASGDETFRRWILTNQGEVRKILHDHGGPTYSRDRIGKLVHDAYSRHMATWADETGGDPNPRAQSTWAQLTEEAREMDRRIGEEILAAIRRSPELRKEVTRR